MRWTKQGAENFLLLRAVAENGEWDDYHRFRRQLRQVHLCNSLSPDQLVAGVQSMAQPPSSKIMRLIKPPNAVVANAISIKNPWLIDRPSTHLECT